VVCVDLLGEKVNANCKKFNAKILKFNANSEKLNANFKKVNEKIQMRWVFFGEHDVHT
jgi:hypothetical protein